MLKHTVTMATTILTYTSQRLQNVPRKCLGNGAKSGGHSSVLKSFNYLARGRGLKKIPSQNRVKSFLLQELLFEKSRNLRRLQ